MTISLFFIQCCFICTSTCFKLYQVTKIGLNTILCLIMYNQRMSFLNTRSTFTCMFNSKYISVTTKNTCFCFLHGIQQCQLHILLESTAQALNYDTDVFLSYTNLIILTMNSKLDYHYQSANISIHLILLGVDPTTSCRSLSYIKR